MADSVTRGNPAWLQAMLAQMYPGNNEMTPDELALTMSSNTPPQGYGSTASNPLMKSAYAAPGANSPTHPGNLSGIAQFAGPPIPGDYPTPPPDPRRVGGAPAVANNPPVNPSLSASTTPQQQGVIPGAQRVNRTANNPNYSTFQYQTPNSVGNRAPIYTAANWGNLFGGGQQPQQPQAPAPTQGALANPQSMGPFPQSLFTNAERMGPFPQSLFTRGQQMGPNQVDLAAGRSGYA